MPPSKICTTPGCPTLVESGRCPPCLASARAAADAQRPSAAGRGYDARWRRRRRLYLAAHPTCVLCGARSDVPDHWPTPRRELVEAGVADPDADEHLRPLCTACHNSETAQAPRDARPGWGTTTSPTGSETAGVRGKTSVRVGSPQLG